jgi:hypothetical protein
MFEYYEDEECELFDYDNDSDFYDEDVLSPEEWQDMNSKELLNVWMSIVEYRETLYLPLYKTFNELCEFVYDTTTDCEEIIVPEVQAIKDHTFVKNRNWEYFFSK